MFRKFFKQDKTTKPVVKDAFLVAFEQNLLQLADHKYDQDTLDDLSKYGRLRADEFMELDADSFYSLRQMIAQAVSEMGKFGALLLTPDDDPMELIELPGISGKLRPVLSDIFHKKDFMAWHELHLKAHVSDDLIYEKALLNYHASWATSQAWNYVRAMNFQDVTEPDWLQPFIAAMYGWHEHHFRQINEMPLILETEHEKGPNAPAHYHSFFEIVRKGDPDPVESWINGQS